MSELDALKKALVAAEQKAKAAEEKAGAAEQKAKAAEEKAGAAEEKVDENNKVIKALKYVWLLNNRCYVQHMRARSYN